MLKKPSTWQKVTLTTPDLEVRIQKILQDKMSESEDSDKEIDDWYKSRLYVTK